MRAILDANVFISGIFWEGNFCSQVIEAWKNKKFTLVSSFDIMGELIKTLRTFKIQMGEEMLEEWRKMILENAVLVEPLEKLDIVEADPDDDKFLEVALAGEVQYIVSQDKHLLRIGEFRGIRIVTPEEFLRLF